MGFSNIFSQPVTLLSQAKYDPRCAQLHPVRVGILKLRLVGLELTYHIGLTPLQKSQQVFGHTILLPSLSALISQQTERQIQLREELHMTVHVITADAKHCRQILGFTASFNT